MKKINKAGEAFYIFLLLQQLFELTSQYPVCI